VTRLPALEPWRRRLRGIDDLPGPVVVGCSGGADSVALLALAVDAGLAPVAVHVEHGLRAGSAGEADMVAAVAAGLAAGFARRAVAVAAGPNLEARARDARYGALEAARVDSGATAILVGHTLDDQAETVLLNLLRGSGAPGLAGMAARRDRIVRPLLGLRRDDTREICRRLGIEPLHDPTNDDLAYRRAWVRHELLPMLDRGARRDLAPVLARQADVLRDESELLDELARQAWPGTGEPGAGALAAVRRPLARRAVRCWLGSPPPSFDEVESVLAVARGEARAVELAGRRRVAVRAGVMRVERFDTVTDRTAAVEVRA
jgi:tRNA(Ile)-lysidine synthase